MAHTISHPVDAARAGHAGAPQTPARGAHKHSPRGLLGALVMIALIECVLEHQWLALDDPVSLSWRLSARAAEREAPGCQVLFMGDSLVKLSMLPQVLETQTGLKAYNLGVARGPSPAAYFLLKRALSAGARPQAIVVDFKPSVMIGSPKYNVRYWQELLRPRECIEMIPHASGLSLWVNVALGQLLPSYRCRLEIRDIVTATVAGRPARFVQTNRVCDRNWRLNRGANVCATNAAFNGQITEAEHKNLLSDVWYCHPTNAYYLDRFFALAAANHVQTYWLLPPFVPALQARRERSGVEARYMKLVQSALAKHPEVTLLDARHAGYGAGLFVDPSHLDRRGAVALSTAVASLLSRPPQQLASASRWLELPQYTPQEPRLPLEDLEQSRLAVRASGAAQLR